MSGRFRESWHRSVYKALSWRISGFLGSVSLVMLMTQNWSVALKVGGGEVLLKLILYYFHERIWNRIGLGKRSLRPAVIWLTGYSGAGKTTLAKALEKKLVARGERVELLDGDEIRRVFPQTGFTPQDRIEHIKRVGYLASRLEKAGTYVIVSLISPYREARDFCRNICENFIEVHVSTPLETCEERDPKGLYRKARSGELKEFTGLDSPYEEPLFPEIKIDTQYYSVDESIAKIVEGLQHV